MWQFIIAAAIAYSLICALSGIVLGVTIAITGRFQSSSDPKTGCNSDYGEK